MLLPGNLGLSRKNRDREQNQKHDAHRVYVHGTYLSFWIETQLMLLPIKFSRCELQSPIHWLFRLVTPIDPIYGSSLVFDLPDRGFTIWRNIERNCTPDETSQPGGVE